jgi:hypothetical protein
MPRKTKHVKGYSDILAAGTFGIAGVGVLHTIDGINTSTGSATTPITGYAGQAMSIGAIGMPLMATGNLMNQMNALGQMAGKRRRKK